MLEVALPSAKSLSLWARGTTIWGEMGGLLDTLLQMHQDGDIPEKRVLIFSDSACCVGYLERGWNRPTELETARGTRAALHSVWKSLQVGVYWIRGHSHVH